MPAGLHTACSWVCTRAGEGGRGFREQGGGFRQQGGSGRISSTFVRHSLQLLLLPLSAAVSKQDDCEVGAGGARKACKDCTCGRAEAEAKGEKVTLTQEMLDNPQSSCGNVSMVGSPVACQNCRLCWLLCSRQ